MLIMKFTSLPLVICMFNLRTSRSINRGRWLLWAKNTFVRDLSQYMVFCRAEGGEEMSRERGILLGWFQILRIQLSPENKVYVAINSSNKTVWLFKAD